MAQNSMSKDVKLNGPPNSLILQRLRITQALGKKVAGSHKLCKQQMTKISIQIFQQSSSHDGQEVGFSLRVREAQRSTPLRG